MPDTYVGRRDRAQQRVAALDADAALITHLPNVRYLTGLDSSNAALLVPDAGGCVLGTDSRYTLAAQRDSPDLELLTERFLVPAFGALVAERGYSRVLFEAQHMTVGSHQKLAAEAAGVELAPFGREIEELRIVKDDGELALLGAACRISSEALKHLLRTTGPGITERQLATAVERRMVDLGADGIAFDTIVASGPNG